MGDIYIFMLFVLFVLAVVDLVVGVSNDAVNFLNSAIGSKAVSLRTIMIVASVGVAIGAIFSSGMMEVARKGVFNPEHFYFDEVMIIFMAVMISDVLLLDLFNSLGLPTSTTVSIVFELLGAAVCLALFKVQHNHEPLSDIFKYINNEKALEIIVGILVSVLIAFTVGSIVQYISRLLFTFHYDRRMKYMGAIFGGLSFTALSYFIVFKGVQGLSFVPKSSLEWISDNIYVLSGFCFVVFGIISQVLVMLRINLLRIIIVIGTFGLAMAFAGNDLVNFIGVPIAAWQSYELWSASGVPSGSFAMEALAGKVQTPSVLLLLSGVIMVLTLWFSKKARAVIKTGVELSRQGDGEERFEANALSRVVVRGAVFFTMIANKVLPSSFIEKIDARFQKPDESKQKKDDRPAFDLVRASVNLVVASILISIGTSLKLPLSTTYVTFMVAMGSSLADRAWGLESAVFRVAGVFNVIGGWFMTAGVAFISAFTLAMIIHFGGVTAIILLVILLGVLLLKSFYMQKSKDMESSKRKYFEYSDLVSINVVIKESSTFISEMFQKVDELYESVVDDLGMQELKKLKKHKKTIKKMEKEIDRLKGDVYYFIKSLDDSSVASSKFYIMILDYLQDLVQSMSFIATNSYTHVNNNHKNLKFNQLRDLKGISKRFNELFTQAQNMFEKEEFDQLKNILIEEKQLKDEVSQMILKQIDRIRTTETSPKNTKLYFSILLETKDMIRTSINLLELFREFQKQYKRQVKL